MKNIMGVHCIVVRFRVAGSIQIIDNITTRPAQSDLVLGSEMCLPNVPAKYAFSVTLKANNILRSIY